MATSSAGPEAGSRRHAADHPWTATAVDTYGFFIHPEDSRAEGEEAAAQDVEAAWRWWWQSTQACALLWPGPAHRQLGRQWWARLCRHGGLPAPVLRPLVWPWLTGDGQRDAKGRAVDRVVYEARAARVAELLEARRAQQQQQAAACVSGPPSPIPPQVQTGGGDAQQEGDEGEVRRRVLEAILRDLPRTFPGHCLFAASAVSAGCDSDSDEGVQEGRTPLDNGEAEHVVALTTGQAQLLRLLCVYSTVDREVGYCQGMAFVAGVMLLQAPETDAFMMFRHVMQGQKWQMRQLYRSGFPLLARLLRETQRAVALLLPRLHAHLAREEVALDAFASQWFLTCFSTQLPMPLLCRLWDCFLLDGWRVWVQVAIGLLWEAEPALLRRDMEGTLLYLQRSAKRRTGQRVPQATDDGEDEGRRGERGACWRTPGSRAASDGVIVRWFLSIPVDVIVL